MAKEEADVHLPHPAQISLVDLQKLLFVELADLDVLHLRELGSDNVFDDAATTTPST